MPCLGRDALEALARGRDDGSSTAHLHACEACTAALEELREETALLDGLRRALVRAGDVASPTGGGADPPGFKVLALLGRGGQGEIHEALQTDTGRRVAIKLLRHGKFATSPQRTRFLREIRLAASLSHPGLVTLYQAGETPDGTPFLAMELVRGDHWDVWSDRVRARDPEGAPRRVLEGFVRLCEAVACAHAGGIVHRDIKPSNVLVEAQDRPRLLDLGLAKALGPAIARAEDEVVPTQSGEFLGSLAWSSPEKLGRGAESGLPADVYSLGLLLHRGLTGRHAYPIGGSVVDVVRGVQSLPEGLSGPFAADRRLHAACLALLTRALARAPRERYRDAAELAADARAALAGGALRARAPRPRLGRPAAALVAAILVVAAVMLPRQRHAAPPASVAEAFLASLAGIESDGQAAFERFVDATARLGDGPPTSEGWDPPEEGSAELGRWRLLASHLRWRHPAERMIRLDPERRWVQADGASAAARLALLDDQGRIEVLDLAEPLSRWPLPVELEDPIQSVSLSSDGAWAQIGYQQPEGPRGLWLARLAGAGEASLVHHLPDRWALGWATRSPWLACGYDRSDGAAVVDARDGKEVARIELAGALPRSLDFAEGDGRVLILDGEGVGHVLELPSGRPLEREARIVHSNTAGQLSADLWYSWQTDLHLLDRRTGAARVLHRFSHRPKVVAPGDGSLVAGVGRSLRRFRPPRFDGGVEEWIVDDSWTTSSPLLALTSLRGGRSLAALTSDGTLTVLDIAIEGLPRILDAGHRDRTYLDVCAKSDGTGWVACQDEALVVFDGRGRRGLAVTDAGDTVLSVVGDGAKHAFFATRAGRVGAVELEGVGGVRWLHQHDGPVSALALHPRRGLLASADSWGHLACTPADGSAGQLTELVTPRPVRVSQVEWDPSGEWIAGSLTDGRVCWWRPGERMLVSEPGALAAARCVAFHPATGELVTGHDGGMLAIWDLAAAEPRELLQVPGSQGASVWALAFHPEGRFLAVGSRREVAVWDWSERRPLFAARAHDQLVFALAFHPRLPLLASAAQNGELFEWDFAAGDVLLDAAARAR